MIRQPEPLADRLARLEHGPADPEAFRDLVRAVREVASWHSGEMRRQLERERARELGMLH